MRDFSNHGIFVLLSIMFKYIQPFVSDKEKGKNKRDKNNID